MNYIEQAMRTNSPTTGTFPMPPDLLHATLGMCDEHFEYHMARSWLNAVEELGDFCWFIALAAHAVGCCDPFDKWETYIEENPDAPMLQEALASFVTLVKKSYAYGATFDIPQAQYLLHAMAGRIAAIIVSKSNRSPQDVLNSNIKKLKARFPDKFEQHLALVRDVKQEAAALRAELR